MEHGERRLARAAGRSREVWQGLVRASVIAFAAMLLAGSTNASVATRALDYRVIHQFNGTDGNEPNFMIQATDGNLYGTTILGGVGAQGVGNGTIFRVTPGGSFTLLHAFTDSPDGSIPSRLFQASDGLIYVLTGAGGRFGQGAIFRMDLAGTLSTIHSFTGGADGSGPSYLAEVSPGVFYGTASLGGTAPAGCHLPPEGIAFSMDTAGTITPLHTFCENIDGSGPNSLVPTSDGGFLGTAREDGPLGLGMGSGTLWKMTSSGQVTLLHVFIGNTVEIHDAAQPGSLVKGPDGLYYGIGDGGGNSSNGAIFRTDEAGTIEIVHHFNDYASDGADPGGLILGSDGYFYGNALMGGLPIGGHDQGVIYRFDTAGHTWVLHSFDYTNGGSPAQPFRTIQGIIVGNTIFGGTSFAPMGVSHQLRPTTPVAGLRLQLEVLHPGEATNGRITLATRAPTGGQVVSLFGTNSLQLPALVTVPAGSKIATFHVITQSGTSSYVATITAYIGPLGESTPLQVVP